MRKFDYSRLSTESANPRSRNLDRLSPLGIVRLMNQEDRRVVAAVERELPRVAKAVALLSHALARGGRILFIGAGTSGRLGVLEAAECPPTFNTDPEMIQGIMAGGDAAVFRSKEGAEDSADDGRKQIARRAKRGDVVVGVAASGVTPFVRAALTEAGRRKASTILVTCNKLWANEKGVNVVIAIDTGPELLTGSTRLKAGTACKMVLNMLTTAAMVGQGKAYGHWMVDLQPKSQKLVARGRRLIQHLAQVSAEEAERFYDAAGGRVKTAILMARKGLSRPQAEARLKRVGGFLRKAL